MIPATAIDLNKMCRASWNIGGMCLRISPGTSSGPAALWLGERRKAFCMMTGVMQPEIIGIEDAGVGRTCPSHGKGPPGEV